MALHFLKLVDTSATWRKPYFLLSSCIAAGLAYYLFNFTLAKLTYYSCICLVFFIVVNNVTFKILYGTSMLLLQFNYLLLYGLLFSVILAVIFHFFKC